MIEIALMIEGQDGLTWPRWKRIAGAVQELGFSGLFRSDHFTNARAPDDNALELWTSLTWLADNSQGLEFGPLVTPVSFRHPVFIARMGRDVDDLSGGRLVLGLGAGWQVREHEMFGFDLLDVEQRMDRFAEGVEVVARLLREDGRVDFDGDYYQLQEAHLLPRPNRQGGPALLIGGNGRRRTIPLAARWADEWNGVGITPQEFQELNEVLDQACRDNDRTPDDVRRSIMVNLVYSPDMQSLRDELEQKGRTIEGLRAQGRIVGDAQAVIDQLRAYESAGAGRIMLQWLDQEDLESLESFASQVLPEFNEQPPSGSPHG